MALRVATSRETARQYSRVLSLRNCPSMKQASCSLYVGGERFCCSETILIASHSLKSSRSVHLISYAGAACCSRSSGPGSFVESDLRLLNAAINLEVSCKGGILEL